MSTHTRKLYKQNQKSDIANCTFLIFFINFYRFHCVKNRFSRKRRHI